MTTLPNPLPATAQEAPWALVRRNGDVVDRKPSTRMAYLTGKIGKYDDFCYQGFVMNHDLTRWTKKPRQIDPQDVVFLWRSAPTMTAIDAARATLSVITAKDNRS